VTTAVYPGTFDPFTAGHLDVASRARRLADHLTILVAVNPAKHPQADAAARAAAIRARLPPSWTDVSVVAWAGLTAGYCRRAGADFVVRGVRGVADLRHELPLAAVNQDLGVPTLLLPTRPSLAATSSTLARSLAG
jgi:pantetheine-phosphate adenylyltransferase